MPAKILLYQIIAVGVIWCGLAFFFDELYQSGVYIFYALTSWLLFLIVLYVKSIIRERREKANQTVEKDH